MNSRGSEGVIFNWYKSLIPYFYRSKKYLYASCEQQYYIIQVCIAIQRGMEMQIQPVCGYDSRKSTENLVKQFFSGRNRIFRCTTIQHNTSSYFYHDRYERAVRLSRSDVLWAGHCIIISCMFNQLAVPYHVKWYRKQCNIRKLFFANSPRRECHCRVNRCIASKFTGTEIEYYCNF